MKIAGRSASIAPRHVSTDIIIQIVPIDDAARLSMKLLKNGTLKTYPGYSHGMLTINADILNEDLLAFVKN